MKRSYVIGIHQSVVQEHWVHAWEEQLGQPIRSFVRAQLIDTKEGACTVVPYATEEEEGVIYFVGRGRKNDLTTKRVRPLFATVGKRAKERNDENIYVVADSFTSSEGLDDDWIDVATEGFLLGQYTVPTYETTNNAPDYELKSFIFHGAERQGEIGRVKAEAVNWARTLVNEPPNVLTATRLVEEATQLAHKHRFELEILDREALEDIGAGALLAVNQGSVEPPYLIVLKYRVDDTWDDVIGLVGKGITYDTGGYSLKPKASMATMKGDMGGAAAVLGAMDIVGATRPNRNVIAVVATTDNMISGEAIKPDDVITSLSGKTIEILNTDAEGRLVLADAVTYAKQEGADAIVDVATLTGGVITALGYDKTGTLTNDATFYESFERAAEDEDEFVWRLPLTEADRRRIRTSDVADVNNSPGRDGHMIFGGGFVGEFVGETPWIHVDIAGTSWASNAHALGPKGGTGAIVRTLARFVERATIRPTKRNE